MTTITLCTIIAAIGFNAFQTWQRNAEARQLFSNIYRVLNVARSSALAYHSAVSICGGSASGCSGVWRDGMLVFTDINHNGKIDSNSDHILLHTTLKLDYGNLSWRGALAGKKTKILFQESGLPIGSNGTFRYCGQTAKYHRSVVMNMMGRIRPSPDANRDGIHEDSDGKPFTC